MTTIGFIGSGHIGGTVARLAVGAGHHVVLSNSREPSTLQGFVDELGPLATAATAAEAAEAGEIVVVSVPFKAYTAVPVEPLANKPVIDTNNYYPQRDGHFAELDDASTTSAELLQQHLPKAHVVKAFNNIFYKHLGSLARPAGASDRSVLSIAGDDAAAKAAVTAFFDSIGYDTLDIGPLAEGWRQEPGAPAYGTQYGSMESATGTPATGESVRSAIAAAVR